ncbi:hypothetical protein G6F58_013374 [Rhizopus delemar]|nr:hypothetical protein G6F58_013374 [Rhizopus delemar]
MTRGWPSCASRPTFTRCEAGAIRNPASPCCCAFCWTPTARPNTRPRRGSPACWCTPACGPTTCGATWACPAAKT